MITSIIRNINLNKIPLFIPIFRSVGSDTPCQSIIVPANPTCNEGPKSDSGLQGLDAKLEAAINKQINCELGAAYAYISLLAYFQRDNVGLQGFENFQKESIREEKRHASQLIRLLNQRGGIVKLSAIQPPKQQDWNSPVEALKFALQLELSVLKTLDETQALSRDLKDHHISHFLQTHLLEDQFKSISILKKYIARLEASNNPQAVQLLDLYLNSLKTPIY